MRLTSVFHHGAVRAALRLPDGDRVAVDALDPALPTDVDGVLAAGALPRVAALVDSAAHAERIDPTAPGAAVLRRPGKILGIGLNYVDHADDLAATRPDEPAVFLKGAHTLIGPGEVIPLPPQSDRVTAEAELGLVIGAPAWEVTADEALDHVAGAVAVLDQTAEDILQRNPRFLVRAKNYPGFLAVGAELVPLADLADATGDLASVRVTTMRNGEPHRDNVIGNMTFSPAHLVSFLSHVMPLSPGDLLCTGTPGAVPIGDGDVVTARIEGVGEVSVGVRARDRAPA